MVDKISGNLTRKNAEAAQSGPATPYSFSMLYFEATRRCNLSCAMCMTGSNDKQRVRESKPKELTADEIYHRVLVPAKKLNTVAVVWSGGEFLVRRDAFELLRMATDLGMRSNVCSNCKKLNRKVLERIRDATDGRGTIAVGINALDDSNRETRDAEVDRTLEVLESCKELGLSRHVIVTLGKFNTDTFDKTVQYLVDNDISYNRAPFVPRGSGHGCWEAARFTREDLQDHFHPVLRAHVNGYVSYTPYFLAPEVHASISGGARSNTVPRNPSIGCWCGHWLTVNAEGDVSVCPVLVDSLSAGNVRDAPLDQLVNDSELFATITDRSKLKGKCGRCRYQYTCGGCRAMALYHNGDYMGEDPTCFFEPKDKTTVSEFEEETNRRFKQYTLIAACSGLYRRPDPKR